MGRLNPGEARLQGMSRVPADAGAGSVDGQRLEQDFSVSPRSESGCLRESPSRILFAADLRRGLMEFGSIALGEIADDIRESGVPVRNIRSQACFGLRVRIRQDGRCDLPGALGQRIHSILPNP